MKRLKNRYTNVLKSFCQRSDGSSTIEFIILFPMILMLLLATIELGLLMVRQSMLEMALDKTVRHLRLGKFTNPDQDVLRNAICDSAALIPDCRNSLLIELRAVDTNTWASMSGATTCRDRSEELDPVVELNPGIQNELILIRACSIFSPMFPTTVLGTSMVRDDLGGYALVAKSAFVNEPS